MTKSKDKVTKLKKQTDSGGDWRQRIAREESKAWAAALAEVMKIPNPAQSEEEFFQLMMKDLAAFETETAFRKYLEELRRGR